VACYAGLAHAALGEAATMIPWQEMQPMLDEALTAPSEKD
jgi:hypothetical protein